MILQSSKVLSLTFKALIIFSVLGVILAINETLELFDIQSINIGISTKAFAQLLLFSCGLTLVLYFLTEVQCRKKISASYNDEAITINFPNENSKSIKWSELESVKGVFVQNNPMSARQCWQFISGKQTIEIPVDIDDAEEQVKLIGFFEDLPNFSWQNYHKFYKSGSRLLLSEEQKFELWKSN